MNIQGNILKMRVEYNNPIQYYLPLGEQEIFMNELIGREIRIEFNYQINCIGCGKKTSRSFAQGYCYHCLLTSPETDECILRPELCKAHLGISRDMKWSEDHCLTDHYVYLAVSSAMKVGVTRSTQIPVRWIDQGASRAIIIAKTENRYKAGLIELALKKHLSDKTNWFQMLKNNVDTTTNLITEKYKTLQLLNEELATYKYDDDTITELQYPVIEFPYKVTSVNLDETNDVSGILKGIKGQYLIIENGKAINIRRHNGYNINFSVL